MGSDYSCNALVATEYRPRAERSDALPATAELFGRTIVVPKLVADAGDKATPRHANFFASIANDNTRAAYQRACRHFFTWCETKGIDDLADVEPFQVGAYVKALGGAYDSQQSNNTSRPSACCSIGWLSVR